MELTIRPATVDDAAALLAFMAVVTNEPDNNILYEPGEFALTLEAERQFLARRGADSVMLLAEAHGELVGVAGCDRRQRLAEPHAATLGLTVLPPWRGQGVGTRLLAALMAWAEVAPGLRRVELHVYARNAGAIRLYRRFGFEHEGCLRRGVCKQGQFLDVLVMARLLD